MTQLTTCAHCLDDDFEAAILKSYGVRVVDKSEAPWQVVFEGQRDQLIQMYNEHWSEPEADPSGLLSER